MLKPLSNQEKPISMTVNEPNEQIHAPCIHISARKSHMQPVTYKILLLKLLDPTLLAFFTCFSSLDFLVLPLLACVIYSLGAFLLSITNLKTKLTKGSKMIL